MQSNLKILASDWPRKKIVFYGTKVQLLELLFGNGSSVLDQKRKKGSLWVVAQITWKKIKKSF